MKIISYPKTTQTTVIWMMTNALNANDKRITSAALRQKGSHWSLLIWSIHIEDVVKTHMVLSLRASLKKRCNALSKGKS